LVLVFIAVSSGPGGCRHTGFAGPAGALGIRNEH
jgi:hypothetical protein